MVSLRERERRALWLELYADAREHGERPPAYAAWWRTVRDAYALQRLGMLPDP